MEERNLIYFTSDVHLGLNLKDAPADEREERFISFLKEIPKEKTKALYLLGDIWDFWYEYRDVVPANGIKVISELLSLMDSGVEVWFCIGNHDVWHYGFLESLGMHKFTQPHVFETSGKTFCIGHGDLLGGARWNYRLMMKIFRSKVCQTLFSTLHPWIAFRLGLGWSNSNRRSHKNYIFVPEKEPLYAYASKVSEEMKVDYFIFGHYHCKINTTTPSGAGFAVLDSWIAGGTPYAVFDGKVLHHLPDFK